MAPTMVESLQPMVNTHASSSAQYKPPVTADTIEVAARVRQTPQTITQLIQHRAHEDGSDAPIVAYPSKRNEYQYFTPKQLDAFAEQAAVYYARTIPPRTTSADPLQVIGLLGVSDMEYLITFLAISRLGHTVLFLSTRISKEAYVGLLQATKAGTLLVSPNFEEMGQMIRQEVSVTLQPICTRKDYDHESVAGKSLPVQKLDLSRENKNVSWIIHSSGSTGLPKPIFQTHNGALRNYANNFGLQGFITLPLFHAHGISCLFRAIHSKKLIYIYSAELPLTAQHLVTTLKEHEIQILYAVPYALKLLGESEEGIRLLASLELVMFGGSACPKPIGDKLASQGVRLVSHYGTTETGQLMTSFRDRSDKDWDYVRLTSNLMPYIRWEEQSPGIYELCVLDGWPSKVASNRPDNSYATKDLFEKHPTTPNAWRYYARLDDTLVLENGEKANPLLVEGVARENRHVAEAVAFGANKSCVGIFIIPAEDAPFTTDEQLVDAVWPAIERSNDVVPAFSRISRDMIKVLPKSTTYSKTDKGTVIRAAFYRDFRDMIEAAYDEMPANGSLVLEGNELTAYLRKELLEVAHLREPSRLGGATDLFSLGVDSLQSIRLRAVILKNLDVGSKKLSQNFVFEHPSIQAMADEITRLRLGHEKKVQLSLEERMTALIHKYGQFEKHVPMQHGDVGEHVVVTGVTGSLGAHIAARLVASESVSKVYCLVRAPSADAARHRVRRSMQERCVYHTLPISSYKKMVCLPSDLADARLGLDEEQYRAISSHVTAVMHCAWSVNFNLALESFEQGCIAGARHLIDLCQKAERPTPARFAFCSSVSAVAATPGEMAPEDLPPSLLHAQGMGYAQSKLVTEHIVHNAAKQTGMIARVLRIGQIIADTKHGVWNATEAIPMIFRTAQTINALPKLDENPSWTPVDVVADAFIELTMSREGANVMNVVNPNVFHWTQDLLPLIHQAGLNFEELPQQEWIARLRASNPDPMKNPPIKLFEFFASKYDHDEQRRKLVYDSRKAQKYAPSLRKAGVISSELVKKFIDYFCNQCWTTPKSMASKKHVFVFAGPHDSRKTTAARALASSMDMALIEDRDLTDRHDWLARLHGAVIYRARTTSAAAIAITCPALKRRHRDEIRRLCDEDDVKVIFLLLSDSDKEELRKRTEECGEDEADYDTAGSQPELLEAPALDEVDIVPIDCGRQQEEVIAEIEQIVKEFLAV